MLQELGPTCPLCRKQYRSEDTNRRRVLDHRHLDGLVRGYICAACNSKIGDDHENAAWYRRAADYLDNPPAIKMIGEHFIPGSLGAYRQEHPDD